MGVWYKLYIFAKIRIMQIYKSASWNNAVTVLTVGSLMVGIYLSLKSLDRLKVEDTTLQSRVDSAEARLTLLEAHNESK